MKYTLRKSKNKKERKTRKRAARHLQAAAQASAIAHFSERRADNQSRPLDPVRTPPPPRLIALISGRASAASTAAAVGGPEERVFQLWAAFFIGGPWGRFRGPSAPAAAADSPPSARSLRPSSAETMRRCRRCTRARRSTYTWGESRKAYGSWKLAPAAACASLVGKAAAGCAKGKKKKGRLFRYVLLCCFRETSQSLRRFLHSLPLRTRVENVEGLTGTCASWA